MNLGGIEVISSEYVPQTIREQFRFPRSKKARIRKKWRKDGRNWRETPVVFMVNPNLFKLCDYAVSFDPAFGPHGMMVLGNAAVLKNFRPVL